MGGSSAAMEALGDTTGAKEEAVPLISLSSSRLQRFPFMCQEINIDCFFFFDKRPRKENKITSRVQSGVNEKKPHGKITKMKPNNSAEAVSCVTAFLINVNMQQMAVSCR